MRGGVGHKQRLGEAGRSLIGRHDAQDAGRSPKTDLLRGEVRQKQKIGEVGRSPKQKDLLRGGVGHKQRLGKAQSPSTSLLQHFCLK